MMKRWTLRGGKGTPGSPVHCWLSEPMAPDLKKAIARLARAPDVQHVAIMPDVHLAEAVCIGSVIATSRLLYPQAVGGDIGCGMAALAFEGEAGLLRGEGAARDLLAALSRSVPAMRHPSRDASPVLPPHLAAPAPGGPVLSNPTLTSIAGREGQVEFGTLGRGNHFLEFQADQEDRLWLMVHSGSRQMGQAIMAFHLRGASRAAGGLWFLDAETEAGQAYLNDVAWARAYADASRRGMIAAAAAALGRLLAIQPLRGSLFSCDHNHVQAEKHFGRRLWVHRKGAANAGDGEPGIIPGSMGTHSYHVLGRGCANALRSSSHGAGRRLSRDQARRRVTDRGFAAEMAEVRYDERLAAQLREEAPSAYKDIDAVMRAQRELTRIVRQLRTVMVYKGG